jgi:hypothetical protein
MTVLALVAVLVAAACTPNEGSQDVMLRDPAGLLQQSFTAAEHASGVHVKYLVHAIPDAIRIDADANADGTARGDYAQGDNDIPLVITTTASYVRCTSGALYLLELPFNLRTAQAIDKWLPATSSVLDGTNIDDRLRGIRFANLVTAMLRTAPTSP